MNMIYEIRRRHLVQKQTVSAIACDPGFSPRKYGYSGLLEMVQTYPDLETRKDGGGHWVQPRVISDKAQ